jgi:hypothetical protein
MAIQNKRIILICAGLAMCNVPVAGPAQAQDVSFEEPRAYETGDAPNSVALSDFNGDGRPDLAVTYRGGVSVFLGNGDGTFQTAQNVPGCHPFSVAVGDFNGDGQQDLVVTDTFYDTVCVLLGNGDGSFQAARKIAVGRGPWSLRWATSTVMGGRTWPLPT